MSEVSLTSAIRSSLHSLQTTNRLMEKTQNRISTGNKVNSPMDDASAFFTSKSLMNRANDLFAIKDRMVQSIKTVETASNGLAQIEEMLKQMKGVAEQASAATTVAERTTLEAQYDALRTQLDGIATDSSYNGVNLIKGTPDSLTVKLNEDSTSTLTVTGVASDSAGLGVTAGNDWDNATLATGKTNIEADIALINTALDTVRTTAATLGSNASVLNIRDQFTEDLMRTLQDGAGALTLADMDEEAAKMLALQTRQQLAMSSLSMTQDAQSSILSLFR